MQLERIAASDFDLALTLNSGQVFHWIAAGAGFAGCLGEKPVYLEQRAGEFFLTKGSAAAVRKYFALDHALGEICASLPRDELMDEARDYCRGLRIMRQPKWECLATFICSSMKQVAHIRQMSQALRRRFGTARRVQELVVYTFPSAARIAEGTVGELRACGLGYRAGNLRRTAQLVASGAADLSAWGKLPDEDLHERLCQLPGVGPKVANCVQLFAYERLRAFPIDVWIERVLKQQYFRRRRKLKPHELRDFSARYFGHYGGYAQQYLFHLARTRKVTRFSRP